MPANVRSRRYKNHPVARGKLLIEAKGKRVTQQAGRAWIKSARRSLIESRWEARVKPKSESRTKWLERSVVDSGETFGPIRLRICGIKRVDPRSGHFGLQFGLPLTPIVLRLFLSSSRDYFIQGCFVSLRSPTRFFKRRQTQFDPPPFIRCFALATRSRVGFEITICHKAVFCCRGNILRRAS